MSETETELLRLLNGAERIRPSLEAKLLANPLFSQPHFRFNSRIKSISRAADKLARMRIDKPTCKTAEIPDLLGLRIVTLFNSSLIEALNAVFDLIEDGGSPFESDHRQIVIYSARPDNDPLSLKMSIERWIQAQQHRAIHHESYSLDTLYSSVHVNTACKITVDRLGGTKEEVQLPVEIQLRTAMEDVWGQLSHIAAYTRQSPNPSTMGHLNALKQMIDGCALYADLIKAEAELSLVGLKEATEPPKSAGDQPLAPFKGVPADVLAAFDGAVAQRKAASILEDTLSAPEFLDAAKTFARIEERLRDLNTLSDEARAEAIYRTQMERAFCLLYSNSIPALDEAFALYEALAAVDPNDAVSRLRLGQALRRRGEFLRAKERLLEAAQILEKDTDKRVEARNWVRGAVYGELAVAGWLIYSTSEDSEIKRQALSQSILDARTALARYKNTDAADQSLIGTVNNILYYSWEENAKYGRCSLSEEELKSFADEITIDRVSVLPAYKRDAVLDTIHRVSWHLGRSEEALRFAAAVIEAIREKVKRRSGLDKDPDWTQIHKALTADELDSYLFAVERTASAVVRTAAKKKQRKAKANAK